MTITQLIYFEHVTRTLNISKTAEFFGVSTPGVSRAIRDLEKEYNAELFIRDGNRLRLTPAGIVFRDNILRFLKQYRELENTLQNVNPSEETPFLLGISAQYIPCSAGVLYPYFKNNFSSRNIILREEGVSTIDRLRMGLLDGALFTINENDSAFDYLTKDNTKAMHIGKLQLRLYCHRKLWKNSSDTISLTDLADVPMIVSKPNDKTNYFESLLLEANGKLNTIITTTQNQVGTTAVEQAVGAMLLPEYDYHFSADIRSYRIKEYNYTNIFFLYQKETDAVFDVLSSLRKLYGGKTRH